MGTNGVVVARFVIWSRRSGEDEKTKLGPVTRVSAGRQRAMSGSFLFVCSALPGSRTVANQNTVRSWRIRDLPRGAGRDRWLARGRSMAKKKKLGSGGGLGLGENKLSSGHQPCRARLKDPGRNPARWRARGPDGQSEARKRVGLDCPLGPGYPLWCPLWS